MSAMITSAQRTRIELAVEKLLALLDAIDGDADFEEQHDAEDDPLEPSLADAVGDLEEDLSEYDSPGQIVGGLAL
jgi:hypothetical protein